MRYFAKLATSAVMFVSLASAAAAQPAAAGEEAQMRVSVAGVDLGTDTGASNALRRIHAAANEFCEAGGNIRELSRNALAKACAARMAYLAVHQLNAPLVTARYEKTAGPAILLAQR